MVEVTIKGVSPALLYCKSEPKRHRRDMAKQLLTPLRLIARMNFSLKNYSSELFYLTGMVGKVELVSTFTTAVCESWNVSTNTLRIMLEILNNYSWTRLSVRIIGMIKRQFVHMVTHVFDNSNLSQETLQSIPGEL